MSDDQPINVVHELEDSHARLPIQIPDREMPLPITIRLTSLAIAQRHIGDTCVREGNLYQQLKMDNKLGEPASLNHVINAALIFERYLWGEWSHGIAENALQKTSGEAAAAIEKIFEQQWQAAMETVATTMDANRVDNSPIRPSSVG